MPVTITEPAANLIKKTLTESGLELATTAVALANVDGQLGIAFLSDFTDYQEFFGLKVVVEQIEEDIVLDYYEVSDGREGLIYLGAEERGDYTPPPKKSSCEGCGCGKNSCSS
jgi:hypothetical protein